MLRESYCYIHGENEVADDPYLICCECKHLYPTAKELEEDYYEGDKQTGNPHLRHTPAAEIYFCPHCIHDF